MQRAAIRPSCTRGPVIFACSPLAPTLPSNSSSQRGLPESAISRPCGNLLNAFDSGVGGAKIRSCGDNRQKLMQTGPRKSPRVSTFSQLAHTGGSQLMPWTVTPMCVNEDVRIDCDQSPGLVAAGAELVQEYPAASGCSPFPVTDASRNLKVRRARRSDSTSCRPRSTSARTVCAFCARQSPCLLKQRICNSRVVSYGRPF